MDKILEYIGLQGILPIATIEDESKAEPFAQTMYDSGLLAIEVTLRTQSAVSIVERIAKKFPEIKIGAGTVLTANDAQTAIDAGACFIVSPGFSPKVVEYCLNNSVPVIPGVATPTEMQHAVEYGLEVVKFFPAEAIGGLPYLKAVAAPFKNLKFVPTGGIDQSSMLSYLQFPKTLACAGSWIVQPEMLKKDEFEKIASISRQAVAAIFGFKLRHIDLHTQSSTDARKAIGQLEKIIQFPIQGTEASLISKANTKEIQQSYSGDYIVLNTNFIERAAAFFEQKRITVNPETKQIQSGKLNSFDLNLEVDRFTVRLVQALGN